MNSKTTKQNLGLIQFAGFVPIVLILWMAALSGCEPKQQPEMASSSEPEVVTSEKMSVDPEAVNLLKRGLNQLSSTKTFHVSTQQTLEDVIDNKYRIDFEMSADLTVSRPNKIRVERYGLEMHQLLYYDGEVFTLHNPYDKVYASESLKGNIDDMFHMVRDTFGISASSADLIYPNAFELLSQNVTGGKVLGKEMIGDMTCDHLVFVRPNVSYQIWISDNEPHLPYKYVVTDTSTPHLLSYSTLMTDWDLDPKLSDSMFKYTPTGEANQIYFIRMSESVKKSTD